MKKRVICIVCLIFAGSCIVNEPTQDMFADSGEREALLQSRWQTGMSPAELEVILSVVSDDDTLEKTGETDSYYFDRFYNDYRIRYTFQFKDGKLHRWSEEYYWFE